MRSTILSASLAGLMAAGSGASWAQPVTPDQQYQQQQQQYQDQQQQYQQRQQQYEGAQAQSQLDQNAYDQQRRAYQRARDEYDVQHGSGAFVRYYSAHPDEYDRQFGPGAYGRDFGAPPGAVPVGAPGEYFQPYRDSPCEQKKNGNTAVGGVLGGLAGMALGTTIGLGPGRLGGAIIGAVLGGVVGGSIARSTIHCDARGYYYGYNETYPYREGEWVHGRSGRNDLAYYSSHNCRLAPAPVHYEDRDEYRYVRVCPDEQDRYRFAD